MRFINVGFGNTVNVDHVVSVVSPEGAPIKRMITDARADGRVVDASCGRKTKSVIVTDSFHIILSAIGTDSLKNRLNGKDEDSSEEENDRTEV